MTFLFWLAAATLLITILAALDLVLGNRYIDALRECHQTLPEGISFASWSA